MHIFSALIRRALLVVVSATGLLSGLIAAESRLNVLIAFKNTPGPAEQALVRSHGGTVSRSFTLVPAIAAQIPAAALAGLERNPNVTAVELDGLFHAIATEGQLTQELSNTWGVNHIASGRLHAEGKLGGGVLVAVIDSGIAPHPDLDVVENNSVRGYDFVNSDNDPTDDNGHGTHVAGTIAAMRNGSGVVGVAPAAHLYGLKVLNASGSGSFSNIISALEWCVANGIKITNNSYGAGQDPGTIVKAAFDDSAAAGILHIAAAGNSGTVAGKGNNVGWPARYESVVAVAATNQNNTRASFSSTGPDVELAAPGVSILSTAMNGGTVAYNGTSMASPHVAGVAALLNSLFPDASAQQIRTALQQSAWDLGTQGRDTYYGFGLVDAYVAEGALEKIIESGNGGSNDPNLNPTSFAITNVDSKKTNEKNGSFEITWITDVAASSQVTFASGGTYTDATLKKSHRMAFRGAKGATYEYWVSGSAAGATSTSGPHTHNN